MSLPESRRRSKNFTNKDLFGKFNLYAIITFSIFIGEHGFYMKSFAQKVISFNRSIEFKGKLPANIKVMNPFRENKKVMAVAESFYSKFYNDNKKRKIILGINPGRFGAGVTGIPFTDSKRLLEICKINADLDPTHEPSSVFIYDMIHQFGGVKKFYQNYYINSICPLGFIEKNKKGNWVNRNYYDYEALFRSSENFMTDSLKTQLSFGIDTSVCYVLGKKNAKYIQQINDKGLFFDKIIVLDHPRYIQQYKVKSREKYINDYLEKLT